MEKVCWTRKGPAGSTGPGLSPSLCTQVLGKLPGPGRGRELYQRRLSGQKGPGPTPVGLRAAPSPRVPASA